MSGSPSVARLFARQLARVTDPATGAVDLEALRRLVCGSYEEAERDRRRIDRATQLMGEELEQANRALERLVEDLGLQSLRFEAALQNMPHGLIMYDAAERVVVVNSRLCTVVGLPDGTIRPGMTLRDVVALRWSQDHFTAVDLDALHAERRALLFGQVPREIEERIGDRTFVLASTPMSGGGCVILVQDITERRAAEARITHLAQHDALTGLPNRLQFRTRLQESLAMAHRGRPFALLCLDLDHFKGVNDTLGHPVGDKLLRDVTARLQGALRETDVVARLGGDEFAVIQNAAQQPEAAQVLAERIAGLLGTPFDIDGHRIVIGTSIGIARGPEDGATPDLLLKSADLALYRAKALGRGTWSFFSAEMDVEMQERRRLEMDLRAALANHEFELAYQPLIDVDGLRLSGFEALLRWRSPTRGLVSPGDFVPLAEETGLILPIGAWVLHEATRTAAGWPSDLTVAVNVSAVQFRQPQLVDIVAGALAASGLAPERLELEVTETIMLHDNVQTIAQLHRLRRRGVRISMDDFGTGYSSLSYLRSFPFDKIKIDQSFIRDLETRAEAQAIVRAIAGLGFSLGMRTTAEGVESRDQLAELRAAGCTDAQGYLFGRPMPAAAVPAFLEGRATQGVAGATAAGALTKRPA